jgi:hypothetical protein
MISAVGITTVYEVNNKRVGVRVPVGSRLALGFTQPPIHWVPQAFSPGVKAAGREADHSLAVDLCIHSPLRLHGVVLN